MADDKRLQTALRNIGNRIQQLINEASEETGRLHIFGLSVGRLADERGDPPLELLLVDGTPNPMLRIFVMSAGLQLWAEAEAHDQAIKDNAEQ